MLCSFFVEGNRESKGDTKPRKQVIKPSKDELREAVFLILDTADFATVRYTVHHLSLTCLLGYKIQ
jgi:hypothetical protein